MDGQSPSNSFYQPAWLPSPQYSESGWNLDQSSPGMPSQYFHHNHVPSSSPTKSAATGQRGPQGLRSNSLTNLTPGSTPQSFSEAWPMSSHSYQRQVHTMLVQQPSLSGSFMEGFENTHLDDPFTGDLNLAEPTTPGFPLQTPPPTRDASKHKPRQPRLAEFATPPTIRHPQAQRPTTASRRTPRGPAFGLDGSPFAFTPLQFSPPTMTGWTHSGPMTAPAPPKAVFWDPSPAPSFPSFAPSLPAYAEDPFGPAPDSFSQSFSFSSPPPAQYYSFEPFPPPPQPSIIRPHTTRPTALAGAPNPVAQPAINPNVLLANDTQAGYPTTIRPRSTTTSTATPYATQKDAARREREARLRKPAVAAVAAGGAAASLRPGLRRSATDTALARSNTPLKRQKSNAHPPLGTFTTSTSNTQTTPSRRREVILTVDDRGHASTKVLGDPLPQGTYSLNGELEEEEDEGIVMPGSILTLDAQAAIKEMRKK